MRACGSRVAAFRRSAASTNFAAAGQLSSQASRSRNGIFEPLLRRSGRRSFLTAAAAASSAGAHGAGHHAKAAEQSKPPAAAAQQQFRNPAAVLRRVNDIAFEEHPTPLPRDVPHGHVRVAMKAVGICGSDLHYVHHGKIGPFVLDAPMVLGHEGAGQVVAVGEGVQMHC